MHLYECMCVYDAQECVRTMCVCVIVHVIARANARIRGVHMTVHVPMDMCA